MTPGPDVVAGMILTPQRRWAPMVVVIGGAQALLQLRSVAMSEEARRGRYQGALDLLVNVIWSVFRSRANE